MARDPRTVTVNHHKWRVLVADHLYADGRYCFGICDCTNRVIYVARWVNGEKQTPEQRAATLDHELAHAHLHEIGEHFAKAFEDACDSRKEK